MAPSPAPDRLLGFVLHETARLMRRRFEQYARLDGLGLTRSEASVLITLARQEGSNQAALAETLDIQPIVLVRLLDRLQEAGFVERKANRADRRAHVLRLTAKAGPVVEKIHQLAERVYADAQADMSRAEAGQLLDLLCRAKENLTRAATTGSGTARRRRNAG